MVGGEPRSSPIGAANTTLEAPRGPEMSPSRRPDCQVRLHPKSLLQVKSILDNTAFPSLDCDSILIDFTDTLFSGTLSHN